MGRGLDPSAPRKHPPPRTYGLERSRPLRTSSSARQRKRSHASRGLDPVFFRRHRRLAADARRCGLREVHRAGGRRPEAGEPDQNRHRHAWLRHEPERRQRAQPGQRGALPCEDGPDPRTRPRQPHAPGRGGRDHAGRFRRGGRSRLVLPARSRLDENLHPRRQRGGKLRRPARIEIRRHPQLRHGAGSRPARRRGALDRQQMRQGRGGLLAA